MNAKLEATTKKAMNPPRPDVRDDSAAVKACEARLARGMTGRGAKGRG